ncbi:MAG: prolyl oligopeptidase family serine peptidase [Bacteroidota bacterium]
MPRPVFCRLSHWQNSGRKRAGIQETLPVWNVQKLKTPLLIHTNTNDEDVNSLEVEQLIRALKAENKKFEYQIYENVEGGHIFDRIDTKAAKRSA